MHFFFQEFFPIGGTNTTRLALTQQKTEGVKTCTQTEVSNKPVPPKVTRFTSAGHDSIVPTRRYTV